MAGAPRCCWETKSLFQSQFCQLSACVTLGQLAAYSVFRMILDTLSIASQEIRGAVGGGGD